MILTSHRIVLIGYGKPEADSTNIYFSIVFANTFLCDMCGKYYILISEKIFGISHDLLILKYFYRLMNLIISVIFILEDCL